MAQREPKVSVTIPCSFLGDFAKHSASFLPRRKIASAIAPRRWNSFAAGMDGRWTSHFENRPDYLLQNGILEIACLPLDTDLENAA
jgi:hypothetical protein